MSEEKAFRLCLVERKMGETKTEHKTFKIPYFEAYKKSIPFKLTLEQRLDIEKILEELNRYLHPFEIAMGLEAIKDENMP